MFKYIFYLSWQNKCSNHIFHISVYVCCVHYWYDICIIDLKFDRNSNFKYNNHLCHTHLNNVRRTWHTVQKTTQQQIDQNSSSENLSFLGKKLNDELPVVIKKILIGCGFENKFLISQINRHNIIHWMFCERHAGLFWFNFERHNLWKYQTIQAITGSPTINIVAAKIYTSG